jgi:hypothetical protein
LKFSNEGNDVTIICDQKVLRIDFNGPLADTKEATRRALEIVTGLTIPKEQFVGSKSEILNRRNTFFTLRKSSERKKARALTEKDWLHAKSYIYDQGNFVTHVKPRKGIVELLQRLAREGWEIHIVTSCRGMTNNRLWRWVTFYNIPIVSATRSKDKFPHYSQGGVVLDDELQHLLPVLDLESVVPILLFDPDKHSPVARKTISHLSGQNRLRTVASLPEVIGLLLAA